MATVYQAILAQPGSVERQAVWDIAIIPRSLICSVSEQMWRKEAPR